MYPAFSKIFGEGRICFGLRKESISGGTHTSLWGGGQSIVGGPTVCCGEGDDRLWGDPRFVVGYPTVCCGGTHASLWGTPQFVVGVPTICCGGTHNSSWGYPQFVVGRGTTRPPTKAARNELIPASNPLNPCNPGQKLIRVFRMKLRMPPLPPIFAPEARLLMVPKFVSLIFTVGAAKLG